MVAQELGGFTPNAEITLAIQGTTHAPGSTVEAIVTITGPTVGTYTVKLTNTTNGEELAPLQLTIGGEPGSNTGSREIILPGTPGQVTYVASFALSQGAVPVTDSETLTLAVPGGTNGGGTTSPPGGGGTTTPPGGGTPPPPGGGGTTTPPGGNGDTPPAPQSIALTATAQSPSKINLGWSGAVSKLYRSTNANFTPGADTLIAENNATITSHADTGLTPETTYYYILVPSGNPDLTQGGANATTPAPTPIALTADPRSSVAIKLTWSGSAGTLHRSTEENFTPGSETHIDRGSAESDSSQTEYTNVGLTKNTTYYYILVPSNSDYAQGSANAKTKDPHITAPTQSSITPEDIMVGDDVLATLTASSVTGDDPDEGTLTWTWSFVGSPVRYKAIEGEEWGPNPYGSYCELALPGDDTSVQDVIMTFFHEGFYQIDIQATAHYLVEGQPITTTSGGVVFVSNSPSGSGDDGEQPNGTDDGNQSDDADYGDQPDDAAGGE